MKQLIMILVLAALPATAMAEVFLISESQGDGSWTNTNFLSAGTMTYVPEPDPVVVDTFWEGYSSYFTTPPTTSPFQWDPYQARTPTTAMPGPNDEIRSSMGGGSLRVRDSVGFNQTVGAIRYGDQYWPNQIAGGVNYHFSGGRWDGNFTLNVGTMYHGRNDAEPGLTNADVCPMAIRTMVNYRANASSPTNVNIGEIKMLRTSTLRGSQLADETSSLQISTRSHGQTNPMNLNINIGNIYLNQEMLYLELTGGTTTIGSIGLLDGAVSGNLVTLLTGVPAAIGSGVVNPSAILNLKWTDLYDMIDAGQLYAYPVTGLAFARTYMNYGSEGFYTRLASGAIHPVTRANMFSELMFTSLGDGMVSVRMIPEPASMLLLGLGGLALIRRRRA